MASAEVAELVRRTVDERMAKFTKSSTTSKGTPERHETTSRPGRTTWSGPTPTTSPARTISRSIDDTVQRADAAVRSAIGSKTSSTAQLDDIDRIATAVERRILAQLERRAGRYGGW